MCSTNLSDHRYIMSCQQPRDGRNINRAGEQGKKHTFIITLASRWCPLPGCGDREITTKISAVFTSLYIQFDGRKRLV